MSYTLSHRSISNLYGVNDELADVVHLAITLTSVDFGISEGVRSRERQRQLYEQGRSHTMNSKHLTGDAVDVFAWVDGAVSWSFDDYEEIANAMYKAAETLDIKIKWGGEWVTLRDGPHFERVL